MITKLVIFDFDGTLSMSPKPEDGIPKWEAAKGVKFTHDDWWGSSESLDTKVFDIKLFPTIVNVLKKAQANKNTEVIILSSRVEKLRPYIINVLKKNSVSVRFLELKRDDKTKGDKVLDLINRIPSVKQIDVYDDRNVEINSYINILNDIPEGIDFNIYRVSNGNISLVNKMNENMNENKIGVPKYLPQVVAPYEIILNSLKQDNINYEIIEADPNKLNPLQKLTFSDRVDKVDLNLDQPIWISNTNDVLDGHHRLIKAIFNNKPIKSIRIDLNTNDCCRVLNKYQDIYEYKQKLQFETEVNDVINNYNDKDNELSDFIKSVEEDNEKTDNSPNQIKIIAYRKEPIKNNSIVGNFFILEPMNDYKKYEIEFENLLDTDQLGLSYKDSQNPIDILVTTWFPHINFDKIAEQRGIDVSKLKNRIIAEKARKIGYDGIKYGNKLIQGL